MLLYSPFVSTGDFGLFWLCIMGLALALVYTLALAAKTMREMQLKKRIKELEQFKDITDAELDELIVQQRKIRGTLHDIDTHLAYLEELNNKEQADYFRLARKVMIRDTYIPSYTGNYIIDTVLYSKLKHVPDGTKFTGNGHLPDKLPFIENTDLVSLIGNLIDNAIEAVKWLTKDNRWIELGVKTDGFSLTITMENPYRNKLKKQGDIFISTKAVNGHGYGLENIRTIAERYQGVTNIDTTDNIFYVHVFLQQRDI